MPLYLPPTAAAAASAGVRISALAKVGRATLAPGDTISFVDISDLAQGAAGSLRATTLDDLIGMVWIDYAPTLAQGASANIAKTVTVSRYTQVGKTVTWSFLINPTAAGTTGSAVTLSLPVAPHAPATAVTIGAATIYDASTTVRYVCACEIASSGTQIAFINDQTSLQTGWGAIPNLPIEASDSIRGSVVYEAA